MRYEFRVIGAKEVLECENESVNILNKYSPIFKTVKLDIENRISVFELRIANKCKQEFNMDLIEDDIKKLDSGMDLHQVVLDKMVVGRIETISKGE